MAKLTYKIIGRHPHDPTAIGPGVPITKDTLEVVDVEWTREGGALFPQHKIMTERKLNASGELEDGQVKVDMPGLAVLKDHILVSHGTPDSIVLQECEKKRPRLAETLGIEP
jgi:hypothetical protein